MTDIILFLGPSLPLQEAKKILPDACFLPPVRCGDVLRVMRLNPKIIAIIDGYFENTAAVWHKEILYALENGIRVFGSSSMGALRAAELENFGMIGVGKIFEQYSQLTLIDDDEVAILHAPAQSHYIPLTEAMVNIRETLEHAESNHVIDAKNSQLICNAAKQLPYQERTLSKIFSNASEVGVDSKQLNSLEQWINEGGYINQKQKDALSLLELIATKKLPSSLAVSAKMNRPAFFQALHKNVMCRPFSSYQSWLPIQERVALAARFFGEDYQLVRRLAYLLAATYALAIQLNPPQNQQKSCADSDPLGVSINFNSEWVKKNDCSTEMLNNITNRLSHLQLLIETQKIKKEQVEVYITSFMRLFSDYPKYRNLCQETHLNDQLPTTQICESFQKKEPKRFQTIKYISILWLLIEQRISDLNLQPNIQKIQEYSDRFRNTRHLLTQEEVNTWLTNNTLDLKGYWQLMTLAANFSFLILQNNFNVLNIPYEDTKIWWLLDALWLTGMYEDAKDLLLNPEKIKPIQQEQLQKQSNLENYAHSLDFVKGEQEFLEPLV